MAENRGRTTEDKRHAFRVESTMNCKLRTKSGLTLTEMAVVIAIMALLFGLGLPAIRVFFDSFESRGGGMNMISAALSSARAIAAKEQHYAGIRFQTGYDPCNPDLLKAAQYMIFIVHEEPRKMGNLTIGFRAVEGLKPLKLPDTIGVMDLRYRPGLFSPRGDGIADHDDEINNLNVVRDMTSFSVIFSPSGKLVIHDVRVRNKDGKIEGTETPDVSRDDIFNTLTKITNTDDPVGMFIQDDYPDFGLYKEESRNSFIVFEKDKFSQAYTRSMAWSDYLVNLAPNRIYINPYTGSIISPD